MSSLLYILDSGTDNDPLPAQLKQPLKDAWCHMAARHYVLSEILKKTIALFKGEGIESIPFKGPVLSQMLYGNNPARVFSDIDILVSETDALKAKNILIENGYQPEVRLNDKQEHVYMNFEFDFKLLGENGNIIIELHWDMSGRYLTGPLTLQKIRPFLKDIGFEGISVKTLCPEMLLVYLCVHSSKHLWETLEQVFAVFTLLKQQPDLDKVVRFAGELNCRRMLFVGIWLADNIFAPVLPDQMKQMIAADKEAVRLAKKCRNTLLATRLVHRDPERNRFSPFHLQVRESQRDRLRYLIYLLFKPTRKEWMILPLPAAFSFLYCIIRPLRLIMSFMREIFSGLSCIFRP